MRSLPVFVFLSLLLCHFLILPAMSEIEEEGTVQIVYMETTHDSPEAIEANQIQTLASVLGSEEAARKAILYSYKHTMNGFSAKLTKEQIAALLKQPGVIRILPSPSYILHQGTLISSSP